MKDIYSARFKKLNENECITQSVSGHCANTARFAGGYCPILELEPIARLAGVFHDAGKYSDKFQSYLEARKRGETAIRGSVDHATAGARLILELSGSKLLYEFAGLAVASHHGLNDSVDIKTGEYLLDRRAKKDDKIELDKAKERFYLFHSKEELKALCDEADANLAEISKKISSFVADGGSRYGAGGFYWGMCERMLASLLIDADRTDAACFDGSREQPQKRDYTGLWLSCAQNLEKHLAFVQKSQSVLNECRDKIARSCLEAAKTQSRLFRLTVPTGSGKTLSSLNFALNYAKAHGMERIIYVAPYNSILEQNAETIRSAVGEGIVLEHHSNVVLEPEKKGGTDEEWERALKRYDELTQNWDSPIIATSAVQLLEALFSDKTASVRRAHALMKSVVIFDEVQALPVKCIKLFNLAVNFLTQMAGSAVVLCTATQPLLDKLADGCLLPPVEMADIKGYEQVFKRTELIDETRREGREYRYSIDGLCGFIEGLKDAGQILVVVNTKNCALELYDKLKERMDGFELYHLSTAMCAQHRSEKLSEIKESLSAGKKLVCVSTQLIEAGVDISFKCAVRSLAGLDNLVQTAGRCNRNGGGMGNVYLVQMDKKAEDLDNLPDIVEAQKAMRYVLYCFRENGGGELFLKKYIDLYYQSYLYSREKDLANNVKAYNTDTNIVELLSSNEPALNALKRRGRQNKPLLAQAFKSAGAEFKVIANNGKEDVVIDRDDNVRKALRELERGDITYQERKSCFRTLQRYTVALPREQINTLGNAVSYACEGSIRVLSENYYSKETGVCMNPVMPHLNY